MFPGRGTMHMKRYCCCLSLCQRIKAGLMLLVVHQLAFCFSGCSECEVYSAVLFRLYSKLFFSQTLMCRLCRVRVGLEGLIGL